MRRTDIDLLRVLLCGGVIFAHALLIFADEPRYHLKSAVPDAMASLIYAFLRPTLMTSWFILGGWAALKSFRSRGPTQFARERMTRLLVPLAVGTITFGSAIKYIELRHGIDIGLHGFRLVDPIDTPFFTFFPHNLAYLNRVSWSHLYFLAYLFLMSLLMLPLLSWLVRRAPPAGMAPRWTVHGPALVMGAYLAVTHGYWPYLPNLIHDWANFFFFTLCFALGALVAWWPGFEARLRSEALWLAIVMLVAFAGVRAWEDTTAGRICVGLLGWSAFATFTALAFRFRPGESRLLTYLNDAMLPVFIIHHAPLLLIGWAVLTVPMAVWLKIPLIALGGTAVALAGYHWLIRPWPAMRFLFGLSPAPGKNAANRAAMAAVPGE